MSVESKPVAVIFGVIMSSCRLFRSLSRSALVGPTKRLSATAALGGAIGASAFYIVSPARCNPVLAETVPTVQPSSQMAALHTLLVDFSKTAEVHIGVPSVLLALLETFWLQLGVSGLSAARMELLLHRLAESYGHGTLRRLDVERLVLELTNRGIHTILDPLAHTGFHASLFKQSGLNVEAADASPSPLYRWHPVIARKVEDTSWENFGDGWALLLSWLPHWNEAGTEALLGFRGTVVVVLGDTSDAGDWTGTDKFRDELQRDWTLVANWSTETPWPRVQERLQVFVRRPQ